MRVSRTAITPYTAKEMYTLVADVKSYPRFLPWCRSASLLLGEGNEVRATIELAYHGVQRTFTTHNHLQPDRTIDMRLVDGPFRQLEGGWRFIPLGDQGCKVCLDLNYEFSSRLLTLAVGPVFNPIANSLVEAFHKQAVQIYGKR